VGKQRLCGVSYACNQVDSVDEEESSGGLVRSVTRAEGTSDHRHRLRPYPSCR
jgi:hypothetical protein